jgi:thiol-disulfide isomerase/thioredoxin
VIGFVRSFVLVKMRFNPCRLCLASWLLLSAVGLLYHTIETHADDSTKVFPSPGSAYSASSAELWKAIEEYERVLVMFYAPWCSACEHLKPKYHEAAMSAVDDDGVRFLLIDATAEVSLALQFDVQYYPLVVLIKDNEVWHWKRGTIVTLQKFGRGEFDPSENKYSAFFGPYSRVGIWKYRLGKIVEFITKTYTQNTQGESTSYKAVWSLAVISAMAIVLVVTLIGCTWLFTPPLQRQDLHEE